MKQKYLLFLSYIGTRYRGAVKQIGCEHLIDIDSIEGAIECGLHNIRPRSRCYPKVQVSSRTDAGVHAMLNAAQVELQHPADELYDSDHVVAKMNIWFARCGHEIRLYQFLPVTDDFSYRRNTVSRTYFYRFMIAKNYGENRVPIAELQRAWHIRGEKIDMDALRNALRLFEGRRNYESFSPKNRTKRRVNYVKELMHLSLDSATPLMPEDPLSDRFDFWKITVKSRSFVYNQVRRMIGALICRASGVISEKDIKVMLNCPSYLNFDERVTPAPPQGLYLQCVEYDQEALARCLVKAEKEPEVKPLKSLAVIH